MSLPSPEYSFISILFLIELTKKQNKQLKNYRGLLVINRQFRQYVANKRYIGNTSNLEFGHSFRILVCGKLQ